MRYGCLLLLLMCCDDSPAPAPPPSDAARLIEEAAKEIQKRRWGAAEDILSQVRRIEPAHPGLQAAENQLQAAASPLAEIIDSIVKEPDRESAARTTAERLESSLEEPSLTHIHEALRRDYLPWEDEEALGPLLTRAHRAALEPILKKARANRAALCRNHVEHAIGHLHAMNLDGAIRSLQDAPVDPPLATIRAVVERFRSRQAKAAHEELDKIPECWSDGESTLELTDRLRSVIPLEGSLHAAAFSTGQWILAGRLDEASRAAAGHAGLEDIVRRFKSEDYPGPFQNLWFVFGKQEPGIEKIMEKLREFSGSKQKEQIERIMMTVADHLDRNEAKTAIEKVVLLLSRITDPNHRFRIESVQSFLERVEAQDYLKAEEVFSTKMPLQSSHPSSRRLRDILNARRTAYRNNLGAIIKQVLPAADGKTADSKPQAPQRRGRLLIADADGIHSAHGRLGDESRASPDDPQITLVQVRSRRWIARGDYEFTENGQRKALPAFVERIELAVLYWPEKQFEGIFVRQAPLAQIEIVSQADKEKGNIYRGYSDDDLRSLIEITIR